MVNSTRLPLFCFLFFIAPLLQAADVTLISASGTGVYYDVPTTKNNTFRVYAAYDVGATPNSCNDTGNVGMRTCNTASISTGSTLTINFYWGKTDGASRNVRLWTNNGTNTSIVSTTVTAQANYSISVNWSTLAGYICTSGLSSCSSSAITLKLAAEDSSGSSPDSSGATITLYIEQYDGTATSYSSHCGSSAAGDVICGFSVFPGDQKLYFDDLEPAVSDLTQSNGVNSGYRGLQIYYKVVEDTSDDATTLAAMNNSSSSTSVSITSDDDYDIKLTDLDNDTRYCIIIGGLTNAGTATRFYPDNTVTFTDEEAKSYCGTPAQVFGLLENKKCFVATAAFGSELDPHVQRFRDFRNRILMRSEVGRFLTQLYYAHSPKYAKVIADSPILKTGVRGILWTLLLFVELSLRFGLMMTVLGSTFAMLLIYRSYEWVLIKGKPRFFTIFFLLSMSSIFFSITSAQAAEKKSADTEFLSQDVSSGPDFGSEALPEEVTIKATETKAKKKQEKLVEQEVRNQSATANPPAGNDWDSLTDESFTPIEPETVFESETPAQPEIPVVSDPEVIVPEDAQTERKSAWDRPIEDKVIPDLVQKESGVHYYRVKKLSGNRHSTNVKIGFMPPPNITNTISDSKGNETVITYKDVYPEPAIIPVGMYEYEWSPISSWQLLKAQLGAGGFIAQGNGRFATGEEARERYTFVGIPTFAGVKLRMQFGNAWLVPYAAGGGSYMALMEFRDDGKKRNIVGTPAAYGAGGVMLDMTHFDRETSWIFDREYEISHLWLTAEARFLKTFSKELDFSSNIFLIGVSADY